MPRQDFHTTEELQTLRTMILFGLKKHQISTLFSSHVQSVLASYIYNMLQLTLEVD